MDENGKVVRKRGRPAENERHKIIRVAEKAAKNAISDVIHAVAKKLRQIR